MSIDYGADVKPRGEGALVPLVQQLEEARERLERKEADAAEEKRNVDELERQIGTELEGLGIVGNGSTIRLSSGKTIKLSEQEYVSVPAAAKDTAIAWLRANGYGGLVKEEVIQEKVEPGHLRTLSKELQSSGDKLPSDMFNVYIQKKVKIT